MRPCHLERSNINCRACYSTLKCRPLHTNYDSIVTSTSYMPTYPVETFPTTAITAYSRCITILWYIEVFLSLRQSPLIRLSSLFSKSRRHPDMPSTMSPGVIVKHFSRLIGAAFGTMIVISLRSLSESQWSYGDF